MTITTLGQGAILAGRAISKLLKPKKKTSPTITSVKPNKSDKVSEHKVDLAKIPGETANRWKKGMDELDETGKKIRQLTQKLKNEKKTDSGISKGKDLKD
jgi:hypothetical protein